MTMENAMDHDALGQHLVHQAVRRNDDLAQMRKRRIGKPATPMTEVGQGIAGVANPLRQRGCERRGVASDELDGLEQVVSRWLGPDYLSSHFERRFLTSRCGMTRFSAAAFRLFSSFWRR